MFRASTLLLILAFIVAQPTTAGEKGTNGNDQKSVRALKFTPKDAFLIFSIGGKSKLTRCDDAAALAKLLGNKAAAEAKALAAQVDFTKESIVFVSWTTSGPPDGVLTHEYKNQQVTFYVQGPPPGPPRGARARIGADFLAVPRDLKLAFDPKER